MGRNGFGGRKSPKNGSPFQAFAGGFPRGEKFPFEKFNIFFKNYLQIRKIVLTFAIGNKKQSKTIKNTNTQKTTSP